MLLCTAQTILLVGDRRCQLLAVLSSVVSYELFRSMSFVVLAYCFNPENMIAGGSIDRRGVCVKGGHLCVLAEACIVLLVHILYMYIIM